MDIVYIKELRIDTLIGIFDWERQVRQTVCLDLEMAMDIRQAAATDDIRHTLDYKAVVDRLTSFVEAAQFELVETLAEEITRIVRQEFGVPWVRLRLGKPGALSAAQDVGLVIERGRRPVGGER